MKTRMVTLRFQAQSRTMLPRLEIPAELAVAERDRRAAEAILQGQYQALAVGQVPATIDLPLAAAGLPTRYGVRIEPNPDYERCPTVVLEAEQPGLPSSRAVILSTKSTANGTGEAPALPPPGHPALFDWFLERTEALVRQGNLVREQQTGLEFLLDELRELTKQPGELHVLLLLGLVSRLMRKHVHQKQRGRSRTMLFQVAEEALRQLDARRVRVSYEEHGEVQKAEKPRGFFSGWLRMRQ